MVAKRDHCNYLAAMLMPGDVQAHVFALLAFNVELASVRDQIERNAGTAGIYRLQFWKEAVDVIFGKRKGPVPRQPVATALQAFALSSNPVALQALVSARQQTLGDRPFKDLAAVEEYGRQTVGVLTRLIVDLLVVRRRVEMSDQVNAAVEVVIAHMAAASGLATHLRVTVPLLSRGIVLLPVDLMAIYGLTADSIYRRKNPDALKGLVRDVVKAIECHLMEARARRAQLPRTLRPAFLAAGVDVDNCIGTLRKSDFDLFDGRLQRNFALIAWQMTWRRIRQRY